ncbi:ABC transporter ATP-binding protein [Opitutaceae bacterium EW11]|nr:ABC transporter ATP-binding protein [Opitutaceae bacterium EW11]
MITPPVLVLRDVRKSFLIGSDTVSILRGVNVVIPPGDSVAVLGPSGSGKTTLLNIAVGIEDATAGEVELQGRPIHRLRPNERADMRRSCVGFVFQDFRLIDALSVLDNVTVPLRLAGRRVGRLDAMELLDQLGLASRVDQPIDRLSGGERQRVAIARALIGKPALIVCDEPTGNLDRETATRVATVLFSLVRSSGAALIVATHDESLALQCNRILRYNDGLFNQHSESR